MRRVAISILLLAASCSPAFAQMLMSVPNVCVSHTVTASASGAWSNPATWTPRVPTATDRVRIPAGITVTGADDVGCVTVEGTWNFAGTFTFTTIEVEAGGDFSTSQPFQGIIRDAPIDTSVDPQEYGHGVIIDNGRAYIKGAPRTTWVEHTDIAAGDTVLHLRQAPTGWRAGETVIVFDTRRGQNCSVGCTMGAQREVKTIASVNGSDVTVTTPFQYAHTSVGSPYASPDGSVKRIYPWVTHIGGTSTFRSQNPAGVRGHFIAIAHSDVWLENVTFDQMGRTKMGATTTNGGANPIGRYPVHMHHLVGKGPQSNGRAFTLRGLEVNTTPRYGVVIHKSSWGLVEDSAVYDAPAAAYYFEDGDEYENISQRNSAVFGIGVGSREDITSGFGFYYRGPWNHTLHNRSANHFNSGGTEAAYGFKYFPKFLGTVTVPAGPGQMPSLSKDSYTQGAITQFEGNTCFADDSCFTFWWIQTMGFSTPHGAARSTIKDLTFVRIPEKGVFQYESANMTFDGLVGRDFSRAWAGQDYLFINGIIRNADLQNCGTGFEFAPTTDGTETLIENSQLACSSFNIGKELSWSSGTVAFVPGNTLRIRNVTHLGTGKQIAYMGGFGASNHVSKQLTFVEQHNGNAADNFQWFAPPAAASAVLANTLPAGCVPGSWSGNGCGRIGSPASGLTNAQNSSQYGLSFMGQPLCSNPKTSSAFDGFACGTVSAPPPACTYTVTPTSSAVPAAGGSFPVTVSPSGSSCGWAASSAQSWATVSPSSGTGTATVTATIAPNATTATRTVTLSIAGAAVTVTQAGTACSYTLSTSGVSLASAASSGQVGVTTTASCTWTAMSNASWLTVTAGSGTGNGNVAFSATANPSTTQRTATVTIAGQPVTVTQAGTACSYTLSTAAISVGATASTASVTVSAAAGCTWTATGSNAWVSITGGSTGTGNGTVTVAVTANSTTTTRTATLTIAGKQVTVTQAAASCSYTLSTGAISVGPSASTASVTVSALAGCTWTATGSNGWVSITGGSTGTGNGTVTVAVTANSTTSTRTATLTIAGKPVTVTQTGAACSYTLSTTSVSLASAASTGLVGVTAGSTCTWTATSNAGWLTVTAGSGTGTGSVSFSATANSSTTARTAIVTIAGQPVTVTQAGTACSYTLSTGAISVGATASTAAVTVSAPAGCTWTATGGNTWVSITGGSTGTGNGTVTVAVTANSTTSMRTATLTVAGKPVTVTQAAASCSYTLSTSAIAVGATASTASVTVSAPAGCTWTATGGNAWVSITGGSTGTGNGTVTVAVTGNTTTSTRTATLTIAGKPVTVTQAASSCSYTLSTTVLPVGANATSTSVTLNAPAGCTWSAASNAAWLTITGGSSGTGAGTVTISVSANSSASSRTGTLTVGGQTVTVNQAGASCSYTLSTASLSMGAGGGSASIGITSLSGCSWSAVSSAAWITVTGGNSGSGNGTVTITAAANSSTSSRSGTVAVGGKLVTVTQSGTSCTYSLSAASQAFPSTGGMGSVGLTASGTQCTWTAASTAGWLTIASSASGTGSGTVAYTVAPNATSSTVTGSMSIAGLTYTVTVSAAASASPTVVKVRSESQLQAAVQALVSNTTIELAAGTYTLTRTLVLNGPLQDVTLRGSENNPAEVVLVGGGMNNAAGAAPEALVTTGAVQDLTIANLTIRDVYRHAVHLGPGAQAPRLSNLRLLNAGQAFVRADADPTAGGVPDGVVQGTAFERTQLGRDAATTAIDVRGGANWRIARNVFRNLVAPAGQMGSPAVLMTGGASNTIAEGNTFINCQRGIAFGWTNAARYDHVGGIIRNNFIYRATGWAGEAAILVVDSPGTEVLQNTTFLSGTYPTPIEYRYADTAGVIIANNLLDGTVWARDGAMGQDTNNDGTATAAYFVAAAAGDLHLAPGSPAIDRAAPVQDAMTDWDGDSRPMGAAADMGADEAAPPNRAPTVTLVAPASGATVSTPGTIQVTANAADPDGSVVRVDFYANGTLIGAAEGAPFSISWRVPRQTGSVRVTAVATDNRGARTTSAAITITVVRKGQ